MSRALLVEAYIAALPLTAVAIVSDGRRCRIRTGEPAPGETIKHRFFFRPSHADLVLMTIEREGVTDQAPAAVAAQIERAAATLGAPYQTPAELWQAAAEAVAEIVARVEATNQAGGLKQINRQYKAYRQQQIARAERAVPYSKFLEQRYTVSIVRGVAMSGRII